MKTLSVVCPVYNEEAVIGAFHERLGRVLDGLAARYTSEVIFVVDRGTDATLDVLRGISGRDPRVRVVALSSRFGHQMSLVAGIDHAKSDAVVMLDSDLQHPPEVIPTLLDEFEKGHDVVFTLREDEGSEGFFKRFTSRLFYRAIGTLSTIPIHEGAADFRLISQRVATVFRTKMRERNQFLRGLFGWVGFKQTSVRFKAEKRGAGRTKYSLSRLFRFAAEGIVSFSKRPLVAAIFVGFFFALAGLALGLVTVVQYFHSGNLPPGWATIVVLMAIMSGVQLIFLGVIGLYVGFIFDEVKGRPLYIVEETIGFRE